MTDLTPLLTNDRNDGARLLALGALARVSRSLTRVSATPELAQPVYRARVWLRRFRATLKLYDRPLGEVFSERDRRRLRKLHRVLGRARDLDARIQWLTQAQDVLPAEAVVEASWLLADLRTKRARECTTLARVVAREFRPYAKRWAKRLRHYTEPREAGRPARVTSMADGLAAELERQITVVTRGVEQAEQLATREQLHRLRRQVKLVRALLRPWRQSVVEVTPLYALLSSAQTQLGTMRDAELLADIARRSRRKQQGALAPLTALADALDQVAAEAEAQFAVDWFGGRAARFSEASTAVVAALASSAPVPLEIERKYLLRAVPPEAASAAGVRITQGWLPGTVLRERLRRSVHPDGRVEWTRTVKAGRGVARLELEEPASAMLFESLWPFTAAARVEKVRHTVPDGALRWEIDVFLDRELVLAEIELPAADSTVAFPEWLAPYIVRDVTDEAEYVNANLARDTRRPAARS